MPERTAETILITIATATALGVRYAAIFAKLIATETEVRVLDTSKAEALLLTGMQAPFRRHFKLREMFFHIAMWFSVFITSLVS